MDWVHPERPEARRAASSSELLTQARATDGPPWVLFVGESESALSKAARAWIAGAGDVPVIAPPAETPLSVSLHELPPPRLPGERIVLVERIDRAFPGAAAGGALSATSPLYLLPKLAALAGEGRPLRVVATALAPALVECAPEVLAQRGLAARFEIWRVPGERTRELEEAASGLTLQDATTAPSCLALGLATRDPELRARALERALELDPASAIVHVFAASSSIARRKPKEARERLQRAVELDPNLAAAHYELGKLCIQLDDMDGALAAFRRTTELLPGYPSAWGNLGAALGELQHLDEAAAALERAVALDPTSHALHSNLGVTYRDRGRLDEAEAEFRRALELAPDFVFGQYNLASVLYLQERHAEAIEAFESAQGLDPSRSPRQSLLLAVARLASGDVDGALRDYREVFGRLDGAMRTDMRTIAEWDLKQLAQRSGVSDPLREAAQLLRDLA